MDEDSPRDPNEAAETRSDTKHPASAPVQETEPGSPVTAAPTVRIETPPLVPRETVVVNPPVPEVPPVTQAAPTAAAANGGAGGGGGGNGGGGNGGRPTETVEPDEAGETEGNVDKLRADQRAALGLAIGAGSLIITVILGLGVQYFASGPWIGVPTGIAAMPEGQAKALIEHITALNNLAVERVIKLFNAIVAQSLLPVFTSILGYIFGSRVGSSQKNG